VPCQKCFLLQDKTERSQKVCNAPVRRPKVCCANMPAPVAVYQWAGEGVTEGVTNQKGSAAMAKMGAPEGRWPATLGLAIIYVYVVRSLD